MAANIYICFNALSALHISIHIILQQSYVINSILCSFLKGGKQDTQIYHNLYRHLKKFFFNFTLCPVHRILHTMMMIYRINSNSGTLNQWRDTFKIYIDSAKRPLNTLPVVLSWDFTQWLSHAPASWSLIQPASLGRVPERTTEYPPRSGSLWSTSAHRGDVHRDQEKGWGMPWLGRA